MNFLELYETRNIVTLFKCSSLDLVNRTSFVAQFILSIFIPSVPGSSVGIVTDYWLDGPGSNPGEDEIFRLSRPALGTTQPPVQWVPGLPRG